MFSRLKQKARKRLDERLCNQGLRKKMAVPPKGWVRAIREALGMSSAQLAARVGVKPQSIEGLQKSEVSGSIKLNSLRAVAAAMDCTLVYALVPNTSLEDIVQRKARSQAREELTRIRHHMALEDQQTASDLEEEIQEYIEEHITERVVWSEK